MISMRRSTKILIILLVFLISVYIGLKRSNLTDSFSTPVYKLDNSTAENMFEKSGNYKKIQMKFSSEDVGKTAQSIASILGDGSKNILYSNLTNNNYVAVFEATDSLFEVNSQNLRTNHKLISENVFTNDEAEYDINIEAHLENKQTTKAKILDLINKSSIPERVNQFTRQLEKVQAEIDSLKNQEKLRDFNRKNYILLVQVFRQVDGNSRFYKSLVKFIFTMVVVFLILVAGLILLYYIVVLLLKIMSSVGIRTSRTSSSYHYYSDKPYKRKVKRKYKPLPEDEKKKD